MFELTPLPYPADALAPAISRRTIETHHGKHHAGYIAKVNAAMEAQELSLPTLEEVLAHARTSDESLFNNAAQAWNHGFYWQCMKPHGAGGQPSVDLRDSIEAAFKSMDAFRADFVECAAEHFGSGWIWLTGNEAGVITLWEGHDAETPVGQGEGAPLFVCDVWEHAYYLDRAQDRAAYARAWFDDVLNWDFASAQFAAVQGEGEFWRYPPAMGRA